MTLRFDIQYQTLSLPPPYSYGYTLHAELADASVAVALDWQYTDRDELSEEEIGEEGFTPDDDFQWQGTLPAVWKPVLETLWKQTTWLPVTGAQSEDRSLVITITEPTGQVTTGVPSDIGQWDYLLQELVQAVYEAAQRERPLQIRYLEVHRTGSSEEVAFNISFLHRRCTMTVQSATPIRTQKLPWYEASALLETLYLPDYTIDHSSATYPRRQGRYIDPGDERWYPVGTAVLNPGKKDVLQQLHQRIQKMASSHRKDQR